MRDRRCHMCHTWIALSDSVVHPGTDYGADAPMFCSDECCDPWLHTFEAQQMFLRVAWSRLGAALLGAIFGPPCRLFTRLHDRRN